MAQPTEQVASFTPVESSRSGITADRHREGRLEDIALFGLFPGGGKPACLGRRTGGQT